MNELAMAIVNERPASVVQKIGERLQQSLRPPARNVRREGEQDEQSMNTDTISLGVKDTEEEKEEGGEEEDQDQESSAKTIRALMPIVRMLVESEKILRVITCNDIQHAAFKGTTFAEKEMIVAAKIANFLRPFVQQRIDNNRLPEPHILTRAPLAALSNTVATITSFPSLVQSLSIASQRGLRSLQLTAAGVYDTFHAQWDTPASDKNWITNSYEAGKNKPATFGAYFDVNRIEWLLVSYRLMFAWRLIFVNRWTVRLLGKAKPGKTFVKSNYEARKKGKANITKPTLIETPTLDRLNAEEQAETLALQVKDLTNTLKSLRKELSQLELHRMGIGQEVRKSQWNPGSDDYQKLKEIRQAIRIKRFEAIKLEKALTSARSPLYSLNKALRVRPVTTTTTTTAIFKDNIELIDLLPEIIKHHSSGRKVVFAGTDPGIVATYTMSQEPSKKSLVILIVFKSFRLRTTFQPRIALIQRPHHIHSTSSNFRNLTRLPPNSSITSRSCSATKRSTSNDKRRVQMEMLKKESWLRKKKRERFAQREHMARLQFKNGKRIKEFCDFTDFMISIFFFI